MTFSELRDKAGYDITLDELIQWYKKNDPTPVGYRTIQSWAKTKPTVVTALIYYYARQTKAKKIKV